MYAILRLLFVIIPLIVVSHTIVWGYGTAPISVRIKDIVSVEGVRTNQLVGYGLVVGLNGSGDTVGSTTFTRESLASMLERLGVNVRDNSGAALLNGKNVAAVMVTGNLPPFARRGTKMDITVSALGDAKELRGGTLLVTPLLAADGQVYAVGQGPVAVGGFKAEGQAASVTKGVPTSGRIAAGAIVEKEVDFDLSSLSTLKLSLNNPDFTTAKRIADRINQELNATYATPMDPATVSVSVPSGYEGGTVGFMTRIEQLSIQPDQVAKIIVDDSDGVIVMGAHTRIAPVAISHGSITIKIEEKPEVVQPNPFVQANRTDVNAQATFGNTNQSSNPSTPVTTGDTTTIAADSTLTTNNTVTNPATPQTNTGTINVTGAQTPTATVVPSNALGVIAPNVGTAIVARSDVNAKEEKGKMAVLESGPALQTLVDGLNALGATPREMISILHSVKAAGALQAEIEVI